MKIIAFYSENPNERGSSSPACINKLNYIIDCLLRLGEKVEILSLCSVSNTGKVLRPKTTLLNKNVIIKYFLAYPRKTFFQKIIGKIIVYFQLRFFLNSNISSNETVLFYHSSVYQHFFCRFIKKKKLKAVMEVEEVYGDVSGNRLLRQKEFKLFKYASGYIFPTEFLNNAINTNNKPYLIAHGTYFSEKVLAEQFSDGLIHCVYAGTFDKRKGGVFTAINVAPYLSEKYCVHILGFGSHNEKEEVVASIKVVNQKSKARVIFEGLKTGEEYKCFVQSCHIGLSTQNPTGTYNYSSFPSKILSYMANGLRVVTIKIPVVSDSDVGRFLYYYDKDDPKLIATTIQSINFDDDYDGRGILQTLDKVFLKKFKEFLCFFR